MPKEKFSWKIFWKNLKCSIFHFRYYKQEKLPSTPICLDECGMDGEVYVLVTCPICKESWREEA